MKELIDSLNLPKQILDKTEKLLSTLLGEGFHEIGGIFGNKMRLKRLENQIKILDKANQIMEKNGKKPHQINLKTLVPLLEKSSLEENENLQIKWANLISNIASSKEYGIEHKLVITLSNLSSEEAKILDYLQSKFNYRRDQILERSLLSHRKYNEINPNTIIFSFNDIKKQFNLTTEFANIYIDNLESLGILRNDDPDIDIEDGFSDGEIVEDKRRGMEQAVSLNLDLSTTYSKSEDYYFTPYGLYFVNQCKSI
ncbi:uncharacterized protein DUF4393 [Flavobacterium sp. 270]|uniref:Abi-alpha family protein n=1 Tax=Flavobacterium sp. 270 TaxID=2512114 RepID=UPI001065FC62|nr:Abi-alpha family protein [Flavobacterium sp. 270]TDW49878.1 uncharacterized protein DUF4393 [Flavobacterium sp. 270]